MNQDQLIRFLMDNIDVDALVAARTNGSTIMYFANVANRLQGGNMTQPTRNAVGRTIQPTPIQNLNEEAEDRPPRYTPPVQPQPDNPTVTRNNNQNNGQPRNRANNNQNNGQDRVRVGNL